MVSQAILSAGSVFLATAVIMPLSRRYRAWKASRGDLTLRRDWRGRLVPDLRLRRLERLTLVTLAAIFVLGLVLNLLIMAQR